MRIASPQFACLGPVLLQLATISCEMATKQTWTVVASVAGARITLLATKVMIVRVESAQVAVAKPPLVATAFATPVRQTSIAAAIIVWDVQC